MVYPKPNQKQQLFVWSSMAAAPWFHQRMWEIWLVVKILVPFLVPIQPWAFRLFEGGTMVLYSPCHAARHKKHWIISFASCPLLPPFFHPLPTFLKVEDSDCLQSRTLLWPQFPFHFASYSLFESSFLEHSKGQP